MNMAALFPTGFLHSYTLKDFWSQQKKRMHLSLLKALKHSSSSKSSEAPMEKNTTGENTEPVDFPLPPVPEQLPIGSVTEIHTYISQQQCSRSSQKQSPADEVNTVVNQFLPAIAALCKDRWLVLIAPPSVPQRDELIIAGIDPSRVLLVHPHSCNGLEVIEKALKSGTCGAVLAWIEGSDRETIGRLKIAAETGHSWGIFFRPIMTNSVNSESKTVEKDQMNAPGQLEMGLA